MAIDPPYRFDPFQNLVNVHFETATEILGWATIFRSTRGVYTVEDPYPRYLEKWVPIADIDYDDPDTWPAFYAAWDLLVANGGNYSGDILGYYPTRSSAYRAAYDSIYEDPTYPLATFSFIWNGVQSIGNPTLDFVRCGWNTFDEIPTF